MLKQWEYITSLILGALCLVLSLMLITTNRSNQKLQEQLQGQQIEIDRGMQIQQVSVNILRDLGNAALNNTNVRQLLQRHGYQVTLNQAAPAAGTATATTATPAASTSNGLRETRRP